MLSLFYPSIKPLAKVSFLTILFFNIYLTIKTYLRLNFNQCKKSINYKNQSMINLEI